MPDYSKQIANAISAVTSLSAGAMSMFSAGAPKRSMTVREILDVSYDNCDAEGIGEENSYLWAENCGVRLGTRD